MGGAARFIMLLTSSPLPRPSLLRFSRRSLSSLSTFYQLSLSSCSRPQSSFSVKLSQQPFCTHSDTAREDHYGHSPPGLSPQSRPSHPWPQWYRLIDFLSSSGFFDRPPTGPQDDFVAYEELSDDFTRAARACLVFARERPDAIGSLSSRDIQVVVENGTPFLFLSALDTVRRMKLYLNGTGGNDVKSDNEHMVDLMKYLLSYASKPTASSERNSQYSRGLVESSVRNLLSELTEMNSRVPSSDMSAPEFQLSGRYGATSRALGQNVQMKRGDWICRKCNFMNFARNVKCIECEEPRPKRQLTGGEWECPQCDFFNYGRNLVCLRCDCKRPGEASSGTDKSTLGLGYTNKAVVDSRLAANEEKAQRWFNKVSQMNNSSDLSSAASDEDFPEIMPLRKGVNRFVVSTRKTPLERRLAASQNQRNGGTSLANDLQGRNMNKTTDISIRQSLDNILGGLSTSSETGNDSLTSRQSTGVEGPAQLPTTGPHYRHTREGDSGYVPFLPLPADRFAKRNPQDSTVKDNRVVMENSESLSSNVNDRRDPVAASSETATLGGNSELSAKSVTKEETLDKEREQAEKSERWFKKVAELHDVPDLASAISDEDFPEIMPMRKGENRFVVSKKKDRSLSSPMYKRQIAMEQASNTNFVPFVPFPPDYFAKKEDKQQAADVTDQTIRSTDETSPTSSTADNFHKKLDDAGHVAVDPNHIQGLKNQQTASGIWDSRSSGDHDGNQLHGSENHQTASGNWSSQSSGLNAAPMGGNPTQTSISFQTMGKSSLSSSGYSGNENASPQKANSAGNQDHGSGWTGKSLEGSAVKEPDPLDMSEEAKAERWFRRVAQIKDISELSQIPDEDFPSIMPMRKGVNRFVVSKRKTPLERRLTSPQYRRNLPIVRSDPLKTENENN